MSRRPESIVSSQIALLAGQGLTLGLGLAVTARLAGALSWNDFGLFAFEASLFALFGQVVDGGWGGALVGAVVRNPSAGGRLLRRAALLRWGVVAVLIALLPVIDVGDLPRPWIVAALLALPLRTGASSLAAARRFTPTAVIGLGVQAAFAAVVFTFPTKEVALAGLAVREGLHALLTGWVSGLRSLRPSDGDSHAETSPFRLRALWPLSMAAFFNALYLYQDLFVLERLRGRAVMADYGLGVRLVTPVLATVGLLLAPFAPRLARRAHLVGAAAMSAAVVVVFPAVFMGLGGGLVELLHGAPRPEATRALALLSWTPLLVAFGGAASLALVVRGRIRPWCAIASGGFVLNLVLNLAWAPRWGAAGAAAATLVTEGAVAICAWKALQPKGGIPWRPLFGWVFPIAAGQALVLLLWPPRSAWAVFAHGGLALSCALVLTFSPPVARIRETSDEETSPWPS